MKGAEGVPERSAGMSVSGTQNVAGAVPKVMSVALIEPFDRLRNHPSTGSGTTRRNDCFTKCGGFDKLNHRNANLLDSRNALGKNLSRKLVFSVVVDFCADCKNYCAYNHKEAENLAC